MQLGMVPLVVSRARVDPLCDAEEELLCEVICQRVGVGGRQLHVDDGQVDVGGGQEQVGAVRPEHLHTYRLVRLCPAIFFAVLFEEGQYECPQHTKHLLPPRPLLCFDMVVDRRDELVYLGTQVLEHPTMRQRPHGLLPIPIRYRLRLRRRTPVASPTPVVAIPPSAPWASPRRARSTHALTIPTTHTVRTTTILLLLCRLA
mmetsp:Transcript_21625/g.61531  ORF Transcript_21625/g.61531 Transcript_21625/m.61531 type:complete len:202 (+) Transcript_21625:1026-1631(+)